MHVVSAVVMCGHLQDFTPGKPADQCSSLLCRSNLHLLTCMLHVQIMYMGLTCYFLEYWLERMMGYAKQRTRGKITAQPAHVVVAMELDNRAQQRVALELGIMLQEKQAAQDGTLTIPSSADDTIAAILSRSAAVETCSVAGTAARVNDQEWALIQVGATGDAWSLPRVRQTPVLLYGPVGHTIWLHYNACFCNQQAEVCAVMPSLRSTSVLYSK